MPEHPILLKDSRLILICLAYTTWISKIGMPLANENSQVYNSGAINPALAVILLLFLFTLIILVHTCIIVSSDGDPAGMRLNSRYYMVSCFKSKPEINSQLTYFLSIQLPSCQEVFNSPAFFPLNPMNLAH